MYAETSHYGPGLIAAAAKALSHRLDLADPFQRKWYIRQIIEHGRADDIASLDLDEVARLLEALNLLPHLHSLWARFLGPRHAAR